jgi:hypothetical protein
MAQSTIYQGAADQTSASGDFAASKFHIDQVLAEISTATLVKIVKAPYDASGNAISPGSAAAIGYVDVQPLVNQLNGTGKPTPHGNVFHLSYHRYQSGAGAFIADPMVGDIGKMVVADRDTSQVKSTNAQANPGSRRKFDRADGTFFGCTQGGKPTQWFGWLSKGFNITDAYGNTIVGGQNGVTINGCLINQSGDVITKAGHDLDKHLHSGVTTGSGNTGMPV